ncbi:MAG: hypothetical protein JXR48_02325 [Candidatus Delongbacteria bacterium]|nr:hypothetical protein [Candidatus Delongbacteria bacterium]MBN2833783.1 hypothetical protein [Candidatus Delongbacteria bacterium]
MIKEYYREISEDVSLNVTDSKIDSIRKRKIENRSVRLFAENGKTGLSSAVGEVSMADLEKTALENMEMGMTYNYSLPENIKLSSSSANKEILQSGYIEDFGRTFLEGLRKLSNKFIYSNKIVLGKKFHEVKTNSGVELSSLTSELTSALVIKTIGSGNIMDGFLAFSENQIPNFDKVYSEAEIVLSILSAPIIDYDQNEIEVAFMSNELFANFERDFSGLDYMMKNSLFTDKLGDKVFSENVNIFETYEIKNPKRSVPYDDEYFIHEKPFILVENGVMKNLIWDRKNAAKYGKQPTGHGYRNYATNPAISFGGEIMIDPYSGNFNDSCDKITLVPFITSGGDFLPNGDYSTPVQVGFYMKNGKIIGRSKPVTISGNLFKLLSNTNLTGVFTNDLFYSRRDYSVIKTIMSITN